VAGGGGWCALALAVALVVGGAGCSVRQGGGTAGLYHEVKAGENLYRIGKAYGVPFQTLSQVNGLANPDRIEIGQRILIPGGGRSLPVGVITPERARMDRPRKHELPKGPRPFEWPVDGGTLTSHFGPRGETFHDGIDISAPDGTPVYAARSGEVVYSEKLRGYGNVIILHHGEGYASVYAHNSAHLVGVGTRVQRGQMIARIGETGRTSGPNLHFEVRKDNVARNPLYYLPAPRDAARVASVTPSD
jgi:murein DD-endopeptidase MepM/ murein hydrolase activator NlpD